mmetsp:Transcript_19283/g.49453  ORF Transcript_19283/g.49453 Transcript_19283/m.49453 type:complete len:216 (-) Transcript_19283:182-829(-)
MVEFPARTNFHALLNLRLGLLRNQPRQRELPAIHETLAQGRFLMKHLSAPESLLSMMTNQRQKNPNSRKRLACLVLLNPRSSLAPSLFSVLMTKMTPLTPEAHQNLQLHLLPPALTRLVLVAAMRLVLVAAMRSVPVVASNLRTLVVLGSILGVVLLLFLPLPLLLLLLLLLNLHLSIFWVEQWMLRAATPSLLFLMDLDPAEHHSHLLKFQLQS